MSVATEVGSLARELLRKENAPVESARKRYPQLLELKGADAKSIAELQEVMRVLDKSSGDLSADLELLRRARDLLPVIHSGSGLVEKMVAAAKAVEDHAAETPRIMEERRREHYRLLTIQSDLGSIYGTAQRAVQDLQMLKTVNPANADVLRYVEVPELI